MIWELIGYSTEERGEHAVRHREYTSSRRRAEDFACIPRLDFTDSGHGVVFLARRKQPGPRKPLKRMEYVADQLFEIAVRRLRRAREGPR